MFCTCIQDVFRIEYDKEQKSSLYLNSKEDKTMAFVITDECVSCGTCAGECPAEAISEGASHYEINTDLCLDCGTCESACPTGAIVIK